MESKRYMKKIDAIVISWLEVKNTIPTFQKRTYKDIIKAQDYLNKLFDEKGALISNAQVKVCYKLVSNSQGINTAELQEN